MAISRKEFIRQLAVAAGAATMPPIVASAKNPGKKANALYQGTSGKDMLDARHKARMRIRRIIVNNDGNDSALNMKHPVSPELFLNKRTAPLMSGTQVDSIFYCDGVNYVYSHLSELTELPKSESKRRLIDHLKYLGTDTLKLMTDYCHSNGKEIFWSVRMNDNHDSTVEFDVISEFKKNNPDLLVGKKGVEMPMMPNKWSPFDYNLDKVRDMMVSICEDVAGRYDVDGIELDFFRHPAFFREQFYGEPVTQAHCDMMTSMVRKIRNVCDIAAQKRGRPMLLAIRVPDSLGFSRAVGLDWEQWLKEDMIDLVTGCDYVKFEPWEKFASLVRKYKVPVYACLEERRLTARGGSAERESTLTKWRGEAYSAWMSGMNGIYVFNRFDPYDQLFKELGDPFLLAKLERDKGESYCGRKGIGYLDPDYWVKGGRDYLRIPTKE